MRALSSHGTPLRIRETGIEPSAPKVLIELKSVSNAEIDVHRFDLPGPVMTIDAFFAAVMPAPGADRRIILQVPNPKP